MAGPFPRAGPAFGLAPGQATSGAGPGDLAQRLMREDEPGTLMA